VLLMAYEWHKLVTGGALPFGQSREAAPASRASLTAFLDFVEGELDRVGYFPAGKRPGMTRNMRDIFHRVELSEQDVRTLWGAIRAIAEGRTLGKP
jgi:tRNA/rRNA methyltransferase